jgi:sugar phosphate isomerase/epimerase
MAWWDKCIETHNELGTVKYMVQAFMPVNENSTMDDLNMYCDYFNSVAYKTAASSMAFCYHNHNFEYKSIDGNMIYDYLLSHTSNQHVFFELDVYWCQMGGHSPAQYLKDYANRFKCVHIKDEKEIGASGKMDFQPIFEQMKANNIKDWYVEVEQYTNNNPVESVTQSYDFLAKAPYVY